MVRAQRTGGCVIHHGSRNLRDKGGRERQRGGHPEDRDPVRTSCPETHAAEEPRETPS